MLEFAELADLKLRAENSTSIEDAVFSVLQHLGKPVRFKELKSVMPDKWSNPKKLTVCLKRLTRHGKVQRVLCLTPEGGLECWASKTDTEMLAFIDGRTLRQVYGYSVSYGLTTHDGQPYDLYELGDKILMIHVDRNAGRYAREKSPAS